jgi:hypothetical protein
MNMLTKHNRGAVDGWMISTIGLIVLVLGLGSLAIWALLNYQEQKTNVDGKVDAAVAEARRDQSEIANLPAQMITDDFRSHTRRHGVYMRRVISLEVETSLRSFIQSPCHLRV